MDIVKVILPVFVMIEIGFIGKKVKFLNKEGIDVIKFLVIKIILPVAIFNALGTAKYSVQTLILVAIMLAVLIVSFLLGFLLKPLIKEPYKKYLPFMVCLYEGGMMGYPLYVNLCGAENLSNIAFLDIACLLFGFSVFMGMLEQAETQEKIQFKKLCLNAVKSPAFIATVIGVIVGATGLLNLIIGTSFGVVYNSLVEMLTCMLSPLVLIIIGYNFNLEVNLIVPCLKVIAIRVAVQAILATAFIFTLHAAVGVNKLLDIAVIVMMSCPMSFSMQTFVKDEEGGQFISTTNSLYCIITVIVYIVLAFLI